MKRPSFNRQCSEYRIPENRRRNENFASNGTTEVHSMMMMMMKKSIVYKRISSQIEAPHSKRRKTTAQNVVNARSYDGRLISSGKLYQGTLSLESAQSGRRNLISLLMGVSTITHEVRVALDGMASMWSTLIVPIQGQGSAKGSGLLLHVEKDTSKSNTCSRFACAELRSAMKFLRKRK